MHGSLLSDAVLPTMNLMKGLQLYNDGKIKKMKINSDHGKIEFEDGDDFDGLESEYKFRKTNNGWMAIN